MYSLNGNTQTKSQGFKKKNSNLTIDTGNSKPSDKLGDLKSKLQKEKQMMKKTGRRFRQDNSVSTQQVSISTNHDTSIISTGNSKHDVSIGSEQVLKQTMSLKEISLGDGIQKKQISNSSQIFERQMKQQKKRSKQVHNFLKEIQLEAYADVLIQNGFDDLQTLTEVTTQNLNHVMMRAHQQIKLFEAIKNLKTKLGLQDGKDQKQSQGTTSTIFRLKTQPQEYPSSSSTPRMHSSQIIARLKTQNKEHKQQSGLKPGSFLFSVGSKNWSVQDQVRRACSVCFKVEQQMERKGDCYYCKNCYKYVSEDVLQICLDGFMKRSYKKFQQQ